VAVAAEQPSQGPPALGIGFDEENRPGRCHAPGSCNRHTTCHSVDCQRLA
jgi:hypothetical protein